jgi:hypothetical protein
MGFILEFGNRSLGIDFDSRPFDEKLSTHS